MAISYINQVSAGAATATMPAHLVGDLLIVVAYRNATTAPTLGAGFTNLNTQSGNSNSYRIGYKFATATNDAFGTWTNANTVHGVIYRGVGAIGTNAGATKAAATTANVPTIALANTDGNSWVVAFAGSRQTTSQGTPLAGATTLRSTVTGTTAYSIVADTNGGVASFAATTSANGSSVVSSGASFEMIPAQPTASVYDPFNQTTLDTAKWTQAVASSATFTYASTGAQINFPSTTTAATSGQIFSNAILDITGSEFYANVISVPSSSIATMDSVMWAYNSATTNYLRFVVEAGTIYAQYNIGGSITTPWSATFSTTTHAWWKIRESGGTVYWDTSLDGLSWTNRASVSTASLSGLSLQALQVGMWGYTYGAETGVTGVFKWQRFSTNATYSNYYFNGTPTDPNSVWTNDANLTDGTNTTYATTTTISGSTSSNYLQATSTTAPTAGAPTTETIQSVRARIYGGAAAAGSYLYAYITYSGSGLGTIYVFGNTISYGAWQALSTPSGGWTWAKLNALVAQVYPSGGTAGTTSAGQVDIEVVSTAGSILTKTQTGVSRIAKTVTKTQTGIARMANVVTKTQTSTARVARSITKTQTATARILYSSNQLYDNFNDNTLDTVKWTALVSAGSVTEQNQRMELVHGQFSDYEFLVANYPYNLTNSAISVEVVDAGNQTITSHEVGLRAKVGVGNNMVWFFIGANGLVSYKLVAGVQSLISSTAYNSSTHKFIRIRESGGTIYFDWSTDSNTWTNHSSLANPFGTNYFVPELYTGCWQTESAGSYAYFDNFNYVTPSRTQTATARVAKTVTKTQTATANIATAGTVQKTQTAIARIAKAVTKTQGAVARIAQLYTKTQSSIARVANTRTRTQTSIARVAMSVTKTQASTARIQRVLTKTQPAIARIVQGYTKTQSAIARIAKSVTKTQTAIARVQRSITKTQTATARLLAPLTKTQQARARISNVVTKIQTSVARIAKRPTFTQTAKANIVQNRTKTQPAIARVAVSREKTQTAIASIRVNYTKTQTATARIGIPYPYNPSPDGDDEIYDISTTPEGIITPGVPSGGDQIYNPGTIPTGEYDAQEEDENNIYGVET